jgi:Uma2 family endonuclease
MPDDGLRRELMEGDVFVTPAPSTRHQTVSRHLQYALMTALEETGLASVFDAPVDVILSEVDVLEPDLVIVGAAQCHLISERGIEGAPDVCVEIFSPGTRERDRYLKRRVYERYGVKEYWLVDPTCNQMEAFELVGVEYVLRARYDRASTLVCPLYPTLSIPMVRVFRQQA